MKRPLVFAAVLCIIMILLFAAFGIPLSRAVREGTPLADEETRAGTLTGILGRVSYSSSGSARLEIEAAVFSETAPERTAAGMTAEHGGSTVWRAGKVLAYAEEEPAVPLGSRLIICGTISLFPSPDDPGEFDQRAYYEAQDILLRITAEEIRTEGRAKRYPVREAARKARAWLGSGLNAVFEEEDAGILRALLLGDRSCLSEDLSDLYEAAGIRHVLTVSGLHVSLAAGVFSLLFGWALSFFPWQRLPGDLGKRGYLICRGITAGLAVCFYTELAGCGLPLRRAALMYLLLLLAQAAGQSYDLLSSLAAALLAAVLPCPYVLFQASFQLSFACVLVIGCIFPPLSRFLYAETPLLKAFLLPAVLQMLTLPLQLRHYFVYHPFAFLANLLILPLVMWIVLFSFGAAVLGQLFRPAGILAAGPAHFALAVVERTAGLIRRIPFSTVITGQPGLLRILLYAALAGVSLLLLIRYRKRQAEHALTALMNAGISPVKRLLRESRRCVLAAVFMAWLLSAVFLIRFPDRSLSITSLYVGQGDCHVIRCGKDAYMVDGGSSFTSPARTKILPYLKHEGIRRLAFIMVSHGDEDHMNGLAEVIEADGIRVEELVVSAWDRGGEKTAELEQAALARGISVRSVTEGGILTKGETSFRILSPGLAMPEEENDHSLVLLVSHGGFRGLFTGDIGEETERRLIARYGELLAGMDYLKAAHHGSRNSSGETFLQQASPALTVISCGRGNRYGHPHQETLERLAAAGSEVFRTDRNGAVRITVKTGNTIIAEVFHGDKNETIQENFPEYELHQRPAAAAAAEGKGSRTLTAGKKKED